MAIVFGASKGLLKRYGMGKSLFVGRTIDGGEDFYIDSIKPHVVFVCGARGSGKSYTMGSIIEELAAKNDAVASIVIDPIGVFWSMKSPNKMEKEVELLREWGLEPRGFENVRVLVPVGAKRLPSATFDGYFSIHPSELLPADWAASFGVDRFSPAGLLIDNAIQKAGEQYTIDDLIRVISHDTELQSKEKGFSKQTRRGIISRLESAKYWGIFSDKATPIEYLAQPGKVTVLDVSFLEEPVAALVVGILARKALERRKVESRREAMGQSITFPPVWIFIDEAHTMIPKDHRTPASDSLIEYVKQGRKPGCSIVLATQQPSAINSDVLSQLDIMMVHQLVFEDDIKSVRSRMPAQMPKEWNVGFIRGLKTGQCIVGDRETTSTAFIQARPRMSQHEGRSTLAVQKPNIVMEEEPPQQQEEPKEEEEQPVEEKAVKRIPVVVERIDFERAQRLARGQLERKLFFKKEDFALKMKVYWPFWLIKAVGLEGTTEFLFDAILGELPGSKGLQRIIELSPLAAHILTGPGTLEEIARRCEADPRMVKLQLNRLVNLRLVRVRGRKEKVYHPRLVFPEKLEEFDGEVVNVPPEGRIMEPLVEPDKKLYKLLGLKPVDKELVYMPFAFFRTTKRRQLWVNLHTGKLENRKIRLRI